MRAIRLLFSLLVVLIAGVAVIWLLRGDRSASDVLVIRGGALEIEPWSGELRPVDGDVFWDHHVSRIQLTIAKAENEDEEYVVQDPITLTAVRSLRLDVRVTNTKIVEGALLVAIQDTGVKITLKDGRLARHGDIWTPPGFIQDGRRKRYEIARIECLDANGQVVSRYQNPDMGRAVRFRLKLMP